jgi:DNA modification methylase
MSEINKLILGDNLEILKNMDSESVDLIYLDPPFFSNRNYEVIWGDKGEVRSFEDRFSGGIDHYISWLKERVIEMHRILKPTGSIFLHCDYHADAYIRVFILDNIFGGNNFRKTLFLKRSSNRSSISKAARKNYDVIFLYSKSKNYIYNQQFMELSVASKKLYSNTDERGVYRTVPLLVSGKRNGQTGKVWRGIDPNNYGQAGMHWLTIPANLEKYEAENLIYWGKDGKGLPQLKYYSEQSPGSPLSEVWDDIKLVQGNEAIGYPTQKPMKLLERVISLASNEGDIVLDPFVGGGTTVAVADKLNRKWIGIDQSVAAIKVTEARMQKQQDLFASPFVTQLHKYDYDTMRYKDAFEFESFIITQFGGINNVKQRGDMGLDGKTREGQPIQVKRSDNIDRKIIDNFFSAIQRNDKALFEKNKKAKEPVGFIIAFSFGKGAIQEVARLKNSENIIIKLVTVEEIIPISKKPKLTVTMADKGVDKTGLRDIDFVATGESEAGIEFYMWDFDYKEDKFNPEVMFDKQGLQSYKFKAGVSNIAVKVIDNEGLDNIEIIKLKVNGKVERS